jgi:hypothetical protein
MHGELKQVRSIVLLCACLTVLPACDSYFDPRGPLDQKMVVFSVLSTDRKIQYVRVQQNYMPQDFNPASYVSDNALQDVIVAIRASNGVYFLADTLLARDDTIRYRFPLRSFVLNPFTPLRGESYELIVQSIYYGVASTTVLIPGESAIELSGDTGPILDRPDKHPQDAPMPVIVRMSGVSKGFVGRLYLYYDVLKGSRWIEERVEIPVSSADSSSYSLDYPRYPQLAFTPFTAQAGLYYRNGYYRAILNKVNSQYQTNRIVFKWATFVVLQADKNLFEYYALTHQSLDPYSIRLDEPTTSGINGGLGMVGAYSLDSLVRLLPGDFWGNR